MLQFTGAIAKNFFKFAVAAADLAPAQKHNAHQRVVENQVLLVQGGLQLRLRQPLLVNVINDPDRALVGGIGVDQLARQVCPKNLAVVALHQNFGLVCPALRHGWVGGSSQRMGGRIVWVKRLAALPHQV